MSEYNERDVVGVKENYVFRITEQDHDVVSTITVNGLDVEPKTEYVAEVLVHRGPNGLELVAVTPVETNAEGNRISIPKEKVNETDEIEPGRTANIKLYEKHTEPPADFTDSTEVLDRATVLSDSSAHDGCDSRLTSPPASDYLGDNNTELKFRNTATMEETIAKSHSNYQNERNFASFPSEAREEINASPGDLIEIIIPEATTEAMSVPEDSAEQIKEMYEMVAEIYEAHMEAYSE